MNKPRQTSSIFDAVPISERWYYPIVQKIQEFENSNSEFDFMDSPVSETAPSWVTQCLIKSIEPYWEQAGLGDFSRLNTRMIGAHIGAKASVCDAFGRAYKVFGALRGRDRQAWIKWFGGAEEFQEAMACYRRFSDVLTPRFAEIRSEANQLVIQQSVLEQIHFSQGLSKGLTFMMEVSKSIKLARTKREKDAQARMSVYAFGLLNWEDIEKERGSLTWQQLSKYFGEFVGHESDINEESFKKILARCGLKKLAQVGRPQTRRNTGTRNR